MDPVTQIQTFLKNFWLASLATSYRTNIVSLFLFNAANLTLKNAQKQQKNFLRFFYALLILVRDTEQPRKCGENVEHLALLKEWSIIISFVLSSASSNRCIFPSRR